MARRFSAKPWPRRRRAPARPGIRAGLDPAVGGAGWDAFREIWSARNGRPDGLVILDDRLFADAQLAMLELRVQVPDALRLAGELGAPVTRNPPFREVAVQPLDESGRRERRTREAASGRAPILATRSGRSCQHQEA